MEDGIEVITVGFYNCIRHKILTGGSFGIVILIMADISCYSIFAAVRYLQHDLHIAGNGCRNGCAVLLSQLSGNFRRSGIRSFIQCCAEPVNGQIAGGSVA